MRNFKILFFAFLLLLIPASLNAAFTGKVYVDSNRNGQLDKGERLLKGVMVSDGLNVVSTSSNGEYVLPGYDKAKFIFITTPSGYYTENEYYRRIEAGRDEYDFGVFLLKTDAVKSDGTHSFIHISDTEISSPAGQDAWTADLRDYAANEKSAFIIQTGDICYVPGLKAHIQIMNTANMGVPVYYCIGNHDLVSGATGEELFESLYGPVYYSFDVGNVHYIATPMLGGDYRPSYTKEDVYRWMKNDLALVPAGKPIIVFNHDLLTTEDRFVYGISDDECIDLDEHNLKAWLYGHWHINYIRRHQNAVSICTSTPIRGGIDHAPAAFRVVTVGHDGSVASELRYTYLDKKLGIASIQNGTAPMRADGSIPLYVNVYHTISPTANVTYDCMLDGKKVISGKQLKEKTNFCWYDEMHLPSNCHGRYITISVKASFADGENAEAREIFLCPASGKSGRPDEDWACLLGNPEHVGIARDTLTPPLSLAWMNNVGANIFMSSPIVYDKKVFVASIDENATGKASITALDAANGEILWAYGLDASVKNSIAAAKGKIFAQDIYGTLYAIDASTGSLSWKKQLNVVPIPSLDDGLIASGDTVFAGSGKGLCAIDAETGEEIWRNAGWSQREGTTATLSLGSGVLIGSVQWDALYANDARTGKFLWRVEKDGIRFRAASPAVSGGVLYFISDHSFFKISAATGEILAKKQLPYAVEVTSTPLLAGDKIIFGSSTTGLHALDRETLEEKWNFMTGEAMIYTAPYVAPPAAQIECSPIASGNYVIFGASDGCFYILDRDSGSLCWKYSAGAPIMNTVAASGNMLFGTDFAGNIYGFSK